MNDEPDWSPDERARLQALPRTAESGQRLERRVVDALRAQGLLRSQPAPPISWMAVAASLAMFVCGLAIGRATLPSARPVPALAEGRSYLLLLQPGSIDEADASAESHRVSEYAAWAGSLRGQGRLVSGEKLAPRERVLLSDAASDRPAGGDSIGGYFVVRARDFDEAERIARSCPHLKHGGTIVLREFEKTSSASARRGR